MRTLLIGIVAILLTLVLGGLTAQIVASSKVSACYDAGRKVGGAEQRLFNDVANGDEPMKSDLAIVKDGAPERCK